MRVLFAASEVYPLAKTGGLADVAAALPAALQAQGVDVRVIMPAYRGVVAQFHDLVEIASLAIRGQPGRLLSGLHPGNGVPMLLYDAPGLFDRDGSPYADGNGWTYLDNAWRFASFCEAVAQVACGAVRADLAADIVHLNDWHTGLVPVFLANCTPRPRTLMTIHNLAYQGVYARQQFDALGLPASLWHPGAAEFHGEFSFLKTGLQLADALTTVSPTYARDIQTPEGGERLDGVLRDRAAVLTGILNGIDGEVWNPATDPLIVKRYNAATVVAGKRGNKRALQRELGLYEGDDPLLAFIGRLAHQKGADALLAARAELSALPLQIMILASGDHALERSFREWAAEMPWRIAVSSAYDEGLAHRIEAGADMLIMPSRFEPCGLNQMYSQRYGTVPLVRHVGGLVDSVDDIHGDDATGIHFDTADAGGVAYAVGTAVSLYGQPKVWRRLQAAGMARDWSWTKPAAQYVEIYRSLVRDTGEA